MNTSTALERLTDEYKRLAITTDNMVRKFKELGRDYCEIVEDIERVRKETSQIVIMLDSLIQSITTANDNGSRCRYCDIVKPCCYCRTGGLGDILNAITPNQTQR